MIFLCQFFDGFHARAQKFHGNHLCLVKDDDAPRDIVQLSATGSPIREKRLKKLHVRRYDKRRVPVLRRKALTTHRFILVVILRLHVMLDDIFFSQNVPEDCRRLLDNAGVGNHINDSPLSHLYRVMKRKS